MNCPYGDCGEEIEGWLYQKASEGDFSPENSGTIECPHCERDVGVSVEYEPHFTVWEEHRKFGDDWHDRRRKQPDELHRTERRERDHGRRSYDRARWFAKAINGEKAEAIR